MRFSLILGWSLGPIGIQNEVKLRQNQISILDPILESLPGAGRGPGRQVFLQVQVFGAGTCTGSGIKKTNKEVIIYI